MAAPSAVGSRFVNQNLLYDCCGRDFFPLIEDYFNSAAYIECEDEGKPRIVAVVGIIADDDNIFGAVSSGSCDDGYYMGLALAAAAQQLFDDGVVPDVQP